MSNFNNLSDIIFREIYLQNYGSVKDFEDVINCIPSRQVKKKVD